MKDNNNRDAISDKNRSISSIDSKIIRTIKDEEKMSKFVNLLSSEKKEEQEYWEDILKDKEKFYRSQKDNQSQKSQISNQLELSTTSSYYTVSKAPNVSCKFHGQKYITVASNKFKLVCKKCFDHGIKCDLEFIEEFREDDQLELFCNNHQEMKADFFCDDCKQFICKKCFAGAHRKHNSNIFSYMSNKFIEEIQFIMNEITTIKPRIEESLDSISKMNMKIKSISDSSIKRMSQSTNNISIASKNKAESLYSEFNTIFKGQDIEIESILTRLLSLQKKIGKYLSELNEFSKTVSRQSNVREICRIKKEKALEFKEIINILEDSQNLLNFKVPSVKLTVNEHLKGISKSSDSQFKSLKIYDSSLQTSILSGVSNNSITVRRFSKFYRSGLKYYKTSSLILQVENPVAISGLGLCGLYISLKKFENKNTHIQFNVQNKNKLPIEIKISQLMEDKSLENKLTEKHDLYEVINGNDPTFLLYFKKTVVFKPELYYLITITNLNADLYVDTWSGEVNKIFFEQMCQPIICNTSKIRFKFCVAHGIESDLNEFNQGIISSLIYSKFE